MTLATPAFARWRSAYMPRFNADVQKPEPKEEAPMNTTSTLTPISENPKQPQQRQTAKGIIAANASRVSPGADEDSPHIERLKGLLLCCSARWISPGLGGELLGNIVSAC
jgi:hypothetical protein